MAAWIEIFATAFLLQLLALPGEKGQLVIAGLATTYNPYVVVAGAATAFGGWTALEILLGNALKGAIPVVYLDGVTAALFVFFAIWILYASEIAKTSGDQLRTDSGDPRSDGGTPQRDHEADEDGFLHEAKSGLSWSIGGYLSSFSAMGVAEFGDKTQLITISLAAQYGASPAIWVGEMFAIVPVSLATAVFFSRTTQVLNLTWVLRSAAAMFLLFAVDIVAQYVFGVSVLPL
ncbi:TMEM165/GDT1 family protein [Natrinema gelatinilyticum]|uniref:TMEM165/GDT1 family protein n=1 Tax=Natrinema gelatinilyticum TaxID=2961571 RepID=UPI0020C2EFDC|nr:TMEM165/GDT1 family protein [Natrinema gelatinilyticum]